MNTLRSFSTHCTPASGEHILRVGPLAVYAGVPVVAADLEVPLRMFDGSRSQWLGAATARGRILRPDAQNCLPG
jgi:hypothetical protein